MGDGMKMAKTSEKDIDAAGDAMSVLNDISSGYYPKRDGDDCEDLRFDPDEPAHLRKFFNLMADTLDKAPGITRPRGRVWIETSRCARCGDS